VIHQLTALPEAIDPRRFAEQLAATNRIRVEGTSNLVHAARQAGATRVVAQSVAFAYEPDGGPVKGEDDPLWLDPPSEARRTVEAIASLEQQVTSAEGIEGVVLRYGYFYGPGSAYARDGSVADMVRARQFPIAGGGTGVFSFIHVDDAAAATVAALERGRPGIYNIVDDQPQRLCDWLPDYATALGAPPPRRVPGFLARVVAGRYGHYMMTRMRGASNERARAELGWSPRFASLQDGLRSAETAAQ
jgi:nucleoside-diphosphate-sugar epimerase